jgi:hypothetical protein
MRKLLYALARILGDLSAIFNGRMHTRMCNKIIGRHIASKLWRR